MTQPSREELLADELSAWIEAYAKKVCPEGCLPTVGQEREINLFARITIALRSSAQALPTEPVTWRWRYRITVAEGWSKWIPQDHETIGTFRKIQRHNLEAGLCELQPLYAAPPASSREVREALAKGFVEKWPGDYAEGDPVTGPNALAFETADVAIDALKSPSAAAVQPVGEGDASRLYQALMGITSAVLSRFPHADSWRQGGQLVVTLARETLETFKCYDEDTSSVTIKDQSNDT